MWESLRDVPMTRPTDTLFSSADDVRLAAIETIASRMRRDPATPQIIRDMVARTSDKWIVVRAAGIIDELESEAAPAV